MSILLLGRPGIKWPMLQKAKVQDGIMFDQDTGSMVPSLSLYSMYYQTQSKKKKKKRKGKSNVTYFSNGVMV